MEIEQSQKLQEYRLVARQPELHDVGAAIRFIENFSNIIGQVSEQNRPLAVVALADTFAGHSYEPVRNYFATSLAGGLVDQWPDLKESAHAMKLLHEYRNKPTVTPQEQGTEIQDDFVPAM